MRDTIASTWIYQLVIVFILIFVAFLIVSLTYSKNYKTKNELIDIIEKFEGVNATSIEVMNNYLSQQGGSRVKHTCPTGGMWIGVPSLQSPVAEKTQSDKEYFYCLNRRYPKDYTSNTSNDVRLKNKVLYEIRLFFRFNLPVFGNIYTFTVTGTTNNIYKSNDVFTDIFEKGIKG